MANLGTLMCDPVAFYYVKLVILNTDRLVSKHIEKCLESAWTRLLIILTDILYILSQMTCPTSGHLVVSVTSRDVRTAKTSSPRTSSDGSGPRTVKSCLLPPRSVIPYFELRKSFSHLRKSVRL